MLAEECCIPSTHCVQAKTVQAVVGEARQRSRSQRVELDLHRTPGRLSMVLLRAFAEQLQKLCNRNSACLYMPQRGGLPNSSREFTTCDNPSLVRLAGTVCDASKTRHTVTVRCAMELAAELNKRYQRIFGNLERIWQLRE